MKIHDTVTYFVSNYEPTEEYLDHYYNQFKNHYTEYFAYHCHNVAQKRKDAIKKHTNKIAELIEIKDRMHGAILEIKSQYENIYGVRFTKDVHLLVGLYGSNAYTYRQFSPEIAFCLEKVPASNTHLQILIAHEFGHATNNLFSIKQGIEWENVEWMNPLTWLIQEGIATYLSTQIIDGRLDEYFAFEEDPEWILFARNHSTIIQLQFVHDLNHYSSQEIFKEWFSINGGGHFGVTRLGYYIGYMVVKKLIQELGEEQVLSLWARDDFFEIVKSQLISGYIEV
ncbi:hypothetical protein [Bhargavaea beijingensis]|uniref:Aminopeptidase n=1 Tax=Bhargavaea beijingensis TaxID=426756 RepID=A0ABX9ZEV6_9BACL|nr:hypothetical protein [Bhargavaea beijingensis]RSK34937.1 hypothetical protein EJA12_04485 [Bhargavaea beijingensis]